MLWNESSNPIRKNIRATPWPKYLHFTGSHLRKKVVMCRWKDYSSYRLLLATSFMPTSPLKHWARWCKLTTEDQTKQGVIRILLFLSRLTHIIGRWGKGLWAVIKVSNVGITSAPTLTTETRQPRTGKILFQITQFFESFINFKPHFITTRKEMIYWSLIMEANKWYFTCYKIHQ